MKKYLMILVALCLSAALSACGGGGGGSTGTAAAGSNAAGAGGSTAPSGPKASTVANQVPLTAGGQSYNTFNRAYVSVTVCVPGTTTCQTIPDVVVDTGSTGLRIFASAMSAQMLAGLQEETENGQPVSECAMFAGGNTWGTVRTADVKMAGESASSVPFQVIDDGVTALPSACSSAASGSGMITSQNQLGGNGLIGVSSLVQDCGIYCAGVGSPYYYAGSSEAPVSLQQQVTDPVAMFGSDNNGVLLTLPAISGTGELSTTGTLTFGIDTQSDNTLSAMNLTQYGTTGNSLSATFGNSATSMSAIFDSGSAMYYFADSALPLCTGGYSTSMYCPVAQTALNASVSGDNGTQGTVNFYLDNADTLLSQSPTNYVYNDIGETSASNPALSGTLDMGLTFFFGRSVGFVFSNMPTYEGTGPGIVF